MIRMRPFDKMTYSELRQKYLDNLVAIEAVAFDDEDINNVSGRQGMTSDTFKSLVDAGDKYKKLKDFLFENGKCNRKNLQLLLAGPEEPPKSLGGNGEYDSLRQFFEKIIDEVGIIEEKKGAKLCAEIMFNYVSFRDNKLNQDGSMAYWLQGQLGVKVCPYCNRIYTTTLIGKKKIRPDFDHFYPKSKYPYLSVSLFNLIPSCSVCNKKKGDKAERICEDEDYRIIYPYEESFDEPQRQVSFRVVSSYRNKYRREREDIRELIKGQSDKFSIELQPQEYSDKLEFNNTGGMLVKNDLNKRFECTIKPNLSKDDEKEAKDEILFWERAKNSIKLLLLEDIYAEHKDEIMAIMRNYYQYNEYCIESIMQTALRKRYSKAKKNEIRIFARDMLYFAFLQKEEWGKSPLNKLKSDILKQLDEYRNNTY